MLYYVSVIVILTYMLNYMLLKKKNFSRLINNIFIPIACFLGSWFFFFFFFWGGGGGHGE